MDIDIENEINLKSLNIRNKTRIQIKLHRDIQRENKVDSRRFNLGEIKAKIHELEDITVKDIRGLANRLKRRRHADANDLQRLSNGFLQNNENIIEFIEIQDAIKVIVKMFIGSDDYLQILACECLCNLSLGNEFCCERVSLNAGTYLVTYLNSPNKKLSTTCLWVIANLAVGGGESLKILLSLNIIDALISCLNNSTDMSFGNECCLTFESIFQNESGIISSEDKIKIITSIVESKTAPNLRKLQLIYKILILLNFQIPESLSNSLMILSIISFVNLQNITEAASTNDDTLEIILSIRLLGNLIGLEIYDLSQFIHYLITERLSLSDILNYLFEQYNESVIYNELLWMIGNIYNSTNFHLQIYIKNDEMESKIRIPNELNNL